MSVICAKCRKQAYSGVLVERVGKSGKTYRYIRFAHRRWKRMRYCYVPAGELTAELVRIERKKITKKISS